MMISPRFRSASKTSALCSPLRIWRLRAGIGRVGESVHGGDLLHRLRWRPTQRQVEHSPAAHSRELVAVAEQYEEGAGLISDGEQRLGGVLVEHPGLIDDQLIAPHQHRGPVD